MRFGLKKAAAAVLAVVLAASLCGCDRGYIMTVDGMDIRNGVYLSYLRTAYSMAGEEFEKQNSETSDDDTAADDTSEPATPITKEEIDGKSGSQWIKDETMKSIRRFVAIQRECEELDITLTEDEIKDINTSLTETWDNENQYVQYLYGYKTMGEYYESQGIGQESMREILRVNKLQEKLFMYFYGKDGEYEVKESEINDFLKENYATVKLLSLSYTDASGNKLEKDEDKKAVKDDAQKYADRINKGDKPVDVFYEYNLAKAEEAAKAKAEKDYKEDNEDKLTKEEWIKKQVEEADIKKAESEEELDRVISKESSSFDEKTTEYIFNAPSDGKATIFETENGVYLIVKEDITEKSKWKEDNNENILNEIKGDEFQGKLDIYGQNYDVDADESLVNKKYGPEKLNTSN